MRSRTMVSAALALFVATGADGSKGCGDGSAGSAGAAGSASATGTLGGAAGMPGGGSGAPAPLPIFQVVSGGPGCAAPDSVKIDIDPDTGILRLDYPPLTLSHTPGATFDQTSCTTALTVHAVSGKQYGATGVALHGNADLLAGAHGEAAVHLAFTGAPPSDALQGQILGPAQGAYDLANSLVTGTLLRSECGQETVFTVRVEMSLEVPAGSQDSASLDAVSVSLPIAWWTC